MAVDNNGNADVSGDQDDGEGYTLRAATMLLNRLKKNQSRLSDLSEAMQKMVLSDDPKQQKILKQLVMKNNGDLTKVEMDTKDLVEANDSELALERQTPMTKTQAARLACTRVCSKLRYQLT